MPSQVKRNLPSFGNSMFDHGVLSGISWFHHGDVEQSEEGMVEIIQNLLDFALEGSLTEELLRQDVGIVVGFALNHPEVFKALAGGN